jgi:hypothetical protein
MSNVAINITSQFTGAPAFKKAGKASSGLEKGVKKLGVAMVAAFSVQAITSFGKAAIKAFMDDQKAAAALANTLKNLGLDFAVAANEEFISSLEKSSSVSDDKLRPALSGLITQTGSLTYAQDLLTKAIEISRGSGVALETVTDDLGKAFIGNTKGLAKYETGLTKTQLASMTFEEIMGTLNTQFAGSNAAYLETYAGKMNALAIAGDNASETIGKGLMESLNILVGGSANSIGTVTDSMASLAEGAANFFVGLASYVRKIWDNPTFQKLVKVAEFFIKRSAVGLLVAKITEEGKNQRTTETTPEMTAAQKAFLAEQKARAAAQAKLITATKKAEKDAKKKAADELKLKKAGTLFDLDQIQIVAALKGNVTKEEETRLKLQFAILTGNVTEASKLAGEVARAQGLTKELVAYYSGIPNAKDPFSGWIKTLNDAEAIAKRVAAMNKVTPEGGGTGGGTGGGSPTKNVFQSIIDEGIARGESQATINSSLRYTAMGQQAMNGTAPVVNVQVVLDGEDIAPAVTRVQTNGYLSGKIIALERTLGSFG